MKIPLGSPVIIDTYKSKYNFKNELTKEIALMPEGIVKAYINESSCEFLIIKLRSNIEIKVSENELSQCTRDYYSCDNAHHSQFHKRIKDFLEIEFILTGNSQIQYLLNPVAFLKWLIYIIKDVL